MRNFFLLFTIAEILIYSPVFSQNIVPFNEGEKYGIKNKHTGKVLILAKYKKVLDYNDSIIIVQSRDYRYGAIDTSDNILIFFSKEKLHIEDFDPFHVGQVLETSSYENNPMISCSYYIDKNRNCIPYDYYPCPSWKRLASDSLIVYLYIKKSLKSKYDNQRDSMRYWIDMALNIEPDNPFLNYYKAELILTNEEGNRLRHSDTLNEKVKSLIDTCLYKAILNEKRPAYVAQIMSLQYRYYKNTLKQKEKLKETSKTAKSYNFRKETFGSYFIAGLAYNNGYEIESGIGSGFFTCNDKHPFKPYETNGVIVLGASWQKNLTHNIDGYKIYIFSILKPLRFGICPIYYTNYEKKVFVLRPEFGFGFNYLILSAGYNIGVSKEKFSELNTFNINMRYYLPISVDKSYIQPK